ncbi:MAG: hypothetical protein JWN27_4487 [Candidatus Eremiobacteraeota bacterium]|jgi:hypothetical protein|nr:hypothetical protein [Candidatus Eremiobacteraeota bacterium]
MINFIIRLVGYALLLGVASRIAQTLWSNEGLDGNAILQPFHDEGITVLLLAPVVLALLGVGILRGVCLFLGCALAGAAITAPFVIARVTGG